MKEAFKKYIEEFPSGMEKVLPYAPDPKLWRKKERTDILQPVFLNYFNARTVVTTPNFGKN